MGTTRTVGDGTRQHQSIQSALDYFINYDFSSNGGGPCYIDIYKEGGGTNGEWVLTARLVGPTGTTNVSSSNYLVLRAAANNSFIDHADKATNALRYNPANGVAIRQSGSWEQIFRPNLQYMRFVGLQFKSDTNAQFMYADSGVNYCRFDNCLIRNLSSTSWTSMSGCALELYNCLFHGGRIEVYGSTYQPTIVNCTLYNDKASSSDYGALSISYGGVGALVKNCIAYTNGPTATDFQLINSGTYTSGSGNCAASDTSGPTTGAVTNITMSDLFESLTTDAEDFRIKSSAPSSVKTGGMDTTAETGDLDIVGRSRNGTTPTIGAWEYIQSSQIVAPTSDISAGSWLSTGASMYAVLDESVASDADYIYVSSDSTAEIKFAPAVDPGVHTAHKVKYRIRGNDAATITVSLRQGTSTEIASWAHTSASSSWTSYEQTLSSGEAGNITDYTDLRLRFVTTTP